MTRRLLYPLLVLLAAALIWLMREPDTPAPAPSSGGPSSTQDRASTSRPEDADQAAASAILPLEEEGSRQPLAEAPPALRDEPTSFVVRTVRQEDGQAVAGAEIFLMDRDRIPDVDLAELFAVTPNPETVFASIGQRFLTSADGRARLPQPAGESALIARHENRFGIATIPDPAPREFVVELAASPALKILVVDSNGEPAAGVPLGLRPAATSIWLRDVRTGPDGLAEFHHVRALLPALPDLRLMASVRLVLRDPIGAVIECDRIPEEAVRLVLPPTGVVAVLVKGAGITDGDRWKVELEVLPSSTDQRESLLPTLHQPRFVDQQSTDADRWARFPRVGLGLSLVARVSLPGGGIAASEPFAGPLLPGQEIEIVLQTDAKLAVLHGRVLLADGQPVARATLEAELQVPSLGGRKSRLLSLSTAADGAFRIPVPLDAVEDPPDRLVLSLSEAGATNPYARCLVPLPAPLAAGEFHLGDLVLEELPLLVSGRLVDPDGDGIAAAVLMVEEGLEMARPGGVMQIWQTNFDWVCQTTADGSFALRGPMPQVPVRLVFHRAGYLSLQVPFQPGDSGLLLQVQQASSLRGSVLLEVGVPISLLGISATRTGAQDRQPRSARTDAQGGIVWQDLVPGQYAVRIATTGSQGEILFEVDDIQLASGVENRDSRLQGIDLRQAIRARVNGLVLGSLIGNLWDTTDQDILSDGEVESADEWRAKYTAMYKRAFDV